MASPPRVFISHSSKNEPATQAVLQELTDSLRGAGYPVLVDQDGVVLGADWRATLNAWIGGCDIAIALLSEDALSSDYVAYELSILSYRSKFDPGFTLIPYYVSPVDEDRLAESRLAPAEIEDIQAATKALGARASIPSVLERLAQLSEAATPLDEPTRQLKNLLDGVKDDDVKFHLAALAEERGEGCPLDFTPWIPGDDIRRRLAISMMAAGLARSVKWILSVRSQFTAGQARLEAVENMVGLLGSSWVDYRSIHRLPHAARDDIRRVAVNASAPLVARMYVICAAMQTDRLPPVDSWRIAEASPAPTRRDADAAAASPGDSPQHADVAPGSSGDREYVSALKEAVAAALAASLSADPEELDGTLRDLEEADVPVFVALDACGSEWQHLGPLRDRFPTVTFFLLTGFDPPASGVLDEADVLLLEPRLEAGAEERFSEAYTAKRKVLVLGL